MEKRTQMKLNAQIGTQRDDKQKLNLIKTNT